MSIISNAIAEGCKEGFENALAERCDGYHEPEDRCPMKPKDGCACLRHRWRNLPWWKRLFTTAPMPTNESAVLDAIISQRVDDALTFRKADKARQKETDT